MDAQSENHWINTVHQLGPVFEQRAARHDKDGTFVTENYAALKEHRFFAAMIPEELGGGGVSHAAMCDILAVLAEYCGSTALALSMHQHLLAANIWRYLHGQDAEAILKKVAAEQPVLVSTGARDWLESNGEMEKAEGGYRVTATKHFASQSAIGNILVTSAPYRDPEEGWQVLHFAVPFTSPGVSLLNNWQTLGMRATGSQSVKLESVFVPDSAIALRRPRGTFHPVWNIVLTVAMPLIMSVYVGIARKASRVSADVARKNPKPWTATAVGEMHNRLTSAEVHLHDMVRIANNLEFQPLDRHGLDILMRKTNTANACIDVVTKAMEIAGGQGFYRGPGLERLFRDVQAARYHPLPEKDQLEFTGERILASGLD